MKYLIMYTVFSKDKNAVLKLMQRNKEIAENIGATLICVSTEVCAPCHISLVKPCGKMPSDMYERIKLGLTGIGDHDEVYLTEDDIVYHPDHFKRTPKNDYINYNLEVVYMNGNGYFDQYNRTGVCLHQAFAHAATMRRAIDMKLKQIKDGVFKCYEPFDPDFKSNCYHEGIPSLDIRNGSNVSWSAGSKVKYFNELPYWGKHAEIWQKWGF